jgi:hypothetical protein
LGYSVNIYSGYRIALFFDDVGNTLRGFVKNIYSGYRIALFFDDVGNT